MKTLILAVCLLGMAFIQGCAVYAEPVGGYYVRDNAWYYHDSHGHEWHENHRYHHDRGHDEH